MKTLIIWLLICVGGIWGGYTMQQSQKAYSTDTVRQVVLVDAYDEYNESGRHLFKGIFVDKELKSRFEWAIEPKTFREFSNSGGIAQDMQVKASQFDVNGPYGNEGTAFFGIMFMVFGFLGIGIIFLAFIAAILDW